MCDAGGVALLNGISAMFAIMALVAVGAGIIAYNAIAAMRDVALWHTTASDTDDEEGTAAA